MSDTLLVIVSVFGLCLFALLALGRLVASISRKNPYEKETENEILRVGGGCNPNPDITPPSQKQKRRAPTGSTGTR